MNPEYRRLRVRALAITSAALSALSALATAGCGNKGSPTSPTAPNAVQVVAIAPSSGATLGGTVVTITGARFAAGANVTIGGVAATNVAVQSDTTIMATTGQHASGAADVVVTVGTQTGTLRSGFTYSAPSRVDNQPPVITGITARGTQRSEPKQFANIDEDIGVVATVTDAETPVDQLDYQWSATAGSFTGAGASVRWHAPHTAGSADLTLTVVEHYQTTDDSGLPVTKENRTTTTTTIGVHDSVKEVGDMAYTFLLEFSNQSPAPEQILRNFSDSCPGKKAELDDVRNNQKTFVIQSYQLDPPDVRISFNDVCKDTGHGARTGDACAYVKAVWRSFDKATSRNETASGVDQVNAIYDGSRWWLCNSDFF